jgi:poly(beta-D-mannuronate) lyase
MIQLPSDNGNKKEVENMSKLMAAVKYAKSDWLDNGGHIILKNSFENNDSEELEDLLEDLEFKKPLVIRADTVGERTIGGQGQVVFENAKNVWLYGINFRHHTSEQATVLFKDAKNCVIACCDFQTTSSHKREEKKEDNKEYPWYNYLSISNGDCNCVAYNYFHDKTPSRGHFLWISGDRVRRTVIEYNHFKNLPGIRNKKGNLDKGEAIKMGDSSLGTRPFASIVRYNLFEECMGDVECITNKSSCNIYHHNTFRNNRGSLVLRHGMYNIVRDNIFIGRHNGIRVYGKQIVKNNYFESDERLDEKILCPLVIGNGAEEKETNEASYVRVKGSRFENNVIVVESTENSDDETIVIWGYGDRDKTPEDNKFLENRIIAKSGTIMKLNDGAKREHNDFLNNILYNDGSAKHGDVITREGAGDQCSPPGDKPQVTRQTGLKETDVGPKSERTDQPHCSRDELREVIDFSEGEFREQLESLDPCS